MGTLDLVVVGLAVATAAFGAVTVLVLVRGRSRRAALAPGVVALGYAVALVVRLSSL